MLFEKDVDCDEEIVVEDSKRVFNRPISKKVVLLRLEEWVGENNITGEYQAGLKRNYSTVDHMFTLPAFVRKRFSLNRKLYVAFINFEKAFDSINIKLPWPILLKFGIKGKMYSCIKSMYTIVKVRVRCGQKLTDYIECTFDVSRVMFAVQFYSPFYK